MKHKLFAALISALFMLSFASMSAEAQPTPPAGDWKEKMQSNKIGFLTMEIGLTPTEAQNFWPIYNVVNEELDKATYETFKSYMDLEKAVDSNKSDKEIGKYLEKYLSAMERQNEIRSESVEKYKKILSDKKVAKVFIAEEKFRRQHIRMLRPNGGGPGKSDQANK